MKIEFEIVLVEHGRGGALYSVRYMGEEATELDKFLECKEVTSCEDFEPLTARLNDMVDYLGFRSQYFKIEEGSYHDSITALHYDNGPLRLYCLRRSSVLLIAGYGGPKYTRTYQEDQVLNDAVDKLKIIDELLDKRQKTGEISINNHTGALEGNLIFTLDD